MIFRYCQSLLLYFNHIPFGVYSLQQNYLYTGKELNDNVFYNKWTFLTPFEVIEYRGGICWDISNAIKLFLQDKHIQNYQIYCSMNNQSKSSHTFNIVFDQKNINYYILDASWKRYNKLTTCDTIYQICTVIADRMFNQHQDADHISFYHLAKKPQYHCNCQQYYDIAQQNTKLFDFYKYSED